MFLRILASIFAVGGGILVGIGLTSPNMPWWWWVIAILCIVVGVVAFVFPQREDDF